ncbi:HupE/UreJ family protein [Cypionkella sp. TWP1-2-1b2]|uniref:HupE/UreJ family protein n=1 Tax=Cypionkella sp. TWP1-2-1b2 TaxID=2804675 RepID=UPI003CF5B47C
MKLLAPGLTILTFIASASAASAHIGGIPGGFASGFLHPILGWDHVAAMVAVGIWGAFLGRPALWLLPILFPMIMACGAALGIAGVPLSHIETGIALSSMVLGVLVLFGVRTPLWVACIVIGIFAVCHGYAHGVELPEASNPLSFAIGFIVSTGLLHLCGIGIGYLTKYQGGKIVVRATGAVIALVGTAFLVGAM